MAADDDREPGTEQTAMHASGDLVFARGTYPIAPPEEATTASPEIGRWIAVSRKQPDGSLLVVRNIWNRDAPPAGAMAPAPYGEPVMDPAVSEVCPDGPKALDDAFVESLLAGKVPALVAIHAEDGSRMPPGMRRSTVAATSRPTRSPASTCSPCAT